MLYKNKIDMRKAYEKECPYDKNHYSVLGAHHPFERLEVPKTGKVKLHPETGHVFLCFAHCGAGVVTHELLHAVLWARGHKRGKKQYPIIIENMKQEEDTLHALTNAVSEFYRWYWKIERNFKCLQQ